MDPSALQNLRRLLNTASIATSGRLRRADGVDTSLGEETLTEMLVLEILENLRAARADFDIETFTHHQESQNGADLRIWVNLDDAVIGYSIQAKKATPGAKQRVEAESLDHRVGKSRKRQVRILLRRSVQDLTNPLHLVYQSPTLGRRLGMHGGCYAMSSYLMNRVMRRLTRPVDKTDLSQYRALLFPWGRIVSPPVPGHLTVPIQVVPRIPRTDADMIDMFGSFGDSLGSADYGQGMGAFEYGLTKVPPPQGGGDGGGPDDGPGNGPGGEGVESGEAPEPRTPEGADTPPTPGPEPDRDRQPTPERPSDQRETPAHRPPDGSDSLLFRSAPKRVLRLGAPMEVDEFGTPLIVHEYRESLGRHDVRILDKDGRMS